jgi:hypothetical protein
MTTTTTPAQTAPQTGAAPEPGRVRSRLWQAVRPHIPNLVVRHAAVNALHDVTVDLVNRAYRQGRQAGFVDGYTDGYEAAIHDLTTMTGDSRPATGPPSEQHEGRR